MTITARCAECSQPRETRTCADCGRVASVIDCGHFPQPAEIAASAHDGEPVCAACEARRDNEALPALTFRVLDGDTARPGPWTTSALLSGDESDGESEVVRRGDEFGFRFDDGHVDWIGTARVLLNQHNVEVRHMRRLDGTLSRRAQVRLGASALVYREPDGSYTLERDGVPPLGLGDTAHDAEHALTALHRAAARD